MTQPCLQWNAAEGAHSAAWREGPFPWVILTSTVRSAVGQRPLEVADSGCRGDASVVRRSARCLELSRYAAPAFRLRVVQGCPGRNSAKDASQSTGAEGTEA